MTYLKLSPENIAEQHICCAFSDKKAQAGYQGKKDWLMREYGHGYTFEKLDERGKVFIEYVPLEHSWLPIDGKNFMVINCFWVSGKFKKQGHGKELLARCIAAAKEKGMDGIIAVSSDKKRPFMSDPKFFKKQGFEVVDEAPPFFQLYGMRFSEEVAFPQFKPTAKLGRCDDSEGISVYFSDTCPFTDYYIRQHLVNYGKEKGVAVHLHHIGSQADGHAMPIPWIINSIFYNGELVTLEIKADRHLDKLIG
jgi:GNAT superfamily N-acetyltransferase